MIAACLRPDLPTVSGFVPVHRNFDRLPRITVMAWTIFSGAAGTETGRVAAYLIEFQAHSGALATHQDDPNNGERRIHTLSLPQ